MELETKRLLLRPLRNDDAQAIAHALNNFKVGRNLARVPFPYSVADASFFINLQRGFDPRSRTLAITFKCAPDELIGIIGYEVMSHGDFNFGYWLRECCWRMGIMTEAAQATVRQAFEHDHLAELSSGFHTDNPNSGRILRGLGFEQTGVIKEECLAVGHQVDCMRLKLSRERWLSLQQKGRAS